MIIKDPKQLIQNKEYVFRVKGRGVFKAKFMCSGGPSSTGRYLICAQITDIKNIPSPWVYFVGMPYVMCEENIFSIEDVEK